jgi:hypothetical protein
MINLQVADISGDLLITQLITGFSRWTSSEQLVTLQVIKVPLAFLGFVTGYPETFRDYAEIYVWMGNNGFFTSPFELIIIH